ncbi:MAG: hypothetical protein WAV40_03335 [Microgenomates group bacterium]
MNHRAEFKLTNINKSNIYDYTLERDWFDMGYDSQVYHPDNGPWMFHRYDKDVTIQQIQLLKNTTDLLAIHAPKFTANIACWGLVNLQIEKIIKIIETETQIFSIKKYVDGYRHKEGENSGLDKLLEQFNVEMRSTTGFNWIDAISSNTKVSKLPSSSFMHKKSIVTITDICAYIESIGR